MRADRDAGDPGITAGRGAAVAAATELRDAEAPARAWVNAAAGLISQPDRAGAARRDGRRADPRAGGLPAEPEAGARQDQRSGAAEAQSVHRAELARADAQLPGALAVTPVARSAAQPGSGEPWPAAGQDRWAAKAAGDPTESGLGAAHPTESALPEAVPDGPALRMAAGERRRAEPEALPGLRDEAEQTVSPKAEQHSRVRAEQQAVPSAYPPAAGAQAPRPADAQDPAAHPAAEPEGVELRVAESGCHDRAAEDAVEGHEACSRPLPFLWRPL